MSMRRMTGYLALAVGFASAGCGTMANLDGRQLPPPSPPRQAVTTPFGGVRRDIEWAKSTESPGNLRYVADLPLSLVGDLVTLPKTVIGTHSDTLLEGYNADQIGALYGGAAARGASPAGP
jgi:uncharacterized protein YceK